MGSCNSRARNRALHLVSLWPLLKTTSRHRSSDVLPRESPPMAPAVIHTRALVGLHAPEVLVEVHLANGLPSFTLVGLADTEVRRAQPGPGPGPAKSGFAFSHKPRD